MISDLFCEIERTLCIVLCIISLVSYVLLCSLALNLFVFGFELLPHSARDRDNCHHHLVFIFLFVDSSVVFFHQCLNLFEKRKRKHPSFPSLSLLRQNLKQTTSRTHLLFFMSFYLIQFLRKLFRFFDIQSVCLFFDFPHPVCHVLGIQSLP